MPRLSGPRVDQETKQRVAAAADDHGLSEAEFVRRAVAQAVDSGLDPDGSQHADANGYNADPRLDDIEKRVAALERIVDASGSHTDTGADHTGSRVDPTPDDEIEAVLSDWDYGRGEERAANRRIGQRALAWLRENEADIQKSDVPIEELAGDDARDRTNDSLWTVMKKAFKQAKEKGLVEKPHKDAYRWRGTD